MYYTYVLKSLKNNKFYIGITNNLSRRLSLHNKGRVKSTKSYAPWEVYYFEYFNTRKQAVSREKIIKSWKSREMIEKLKFNRSRGSSNSIEI
ncbi:MAG: endonuclease [Candidatus Yanofskybacteria bacterium CG10_big_fil_rev_8_21_14_0_10_46_23]|uniref:Endonuclease n=1 Tax=Candidatus Yanofskybacteria bacterium CG10_big_fil_rev_8_21_14_0_10_46_23 TaxID=1975098 RepID=A0A2H0R5P2_9BACT|nr:MAG: endonuclease [Candidatus Yanofskybacteria bacterium CG10_big_fil_rev_8_21_14_0_10_46_23]